MIKIGILTLHTAINYGAVLQAYALQKVLQKHGYDSEVIDYRCEKINEKGKLTARECGKYLFRFRKYWNHYKKIKRFHEFVKYHMAVSGRKYDKATIAECAGRYDSIITGSDQIWNFDITGSDTAFMLDFISDCKKKKSYAASFGVCEFSEAQKQCSKRLLNGYSSLLVREDSAKNFLETIGLKSEVVLDPTLLLTKKNWESLVTGRLIQEDYILVYMVASQRYLIKLAKRLAKKMRCKLVFLRMEPQRDERGTGQVIYHAGPLEFLNYIKYADLIMTTSFHGMAFSILLNRDVYYEADKERNKNVGRLTDLAERVGIEDREIVSEELTEGNCRPIDWKRINEKLEEERTSSIKRLIASL